MTDEINRWKVGNVKITRVVEMEGGGGPVGFMESVAWSFGWRGS